MKHSSRTFCYVLVSVFVSFLFLFDFTSCQQALRNGQEISEEEFYKDFYSLDDSNFEYDDPTILLKESDTWLSSEKNSKRKIRSIKFQYKKYTGPYDISWPVGVKVPEDSEETEELKESDVLMAYYKDGHVIISSNGYKIYANPNSSNMFCNLPVVEYFDIAKLDTSKVENMEQMFYRCKLLSQVNVSSFNTENVKSMKRMFSLCEKLLDIDLSKFNTKKVEDLTEMFSSCKELQFLDLSSFESDCLTDLNMMFKKCEKLKSLKLSNSFTCSKVTNMQSLFELCYAIENLDVSMFDTSNVKNMSNMFQTCRNLKTLDLSNFKTDNVTNMANMFNECYKLSSLTGLNFNTEKVLDVSNMFADCRELRELDLSSFSFVDDPPTGKKDFSILISIISSLNSKNKSSRSMYDEPDYGAVASSEIEYDPADNDAIAKIKLDKMFKDDEKLEKIYVTEEFGDITDDTLYSCNSMFMNCVKLTGENGTMYSEANEDSVYARIDGGPNKPGYFSKKK